MSFTANTTDDVNAMLERIGASSLDTLFDEIPQALLAKGLDSIPEALNEQGLMQLASKKASDNHLGICFIGAGCYEHHIPAAVWDITSRGEFLTAYTPYQAEASQGSLQVIYEHQTMISELTGMEIANASLYDGATALAEAALMAIRINKKSKGNRVVVSASLHPYYRDTLKTILSNQHIELITLPYSTDTGTTDLDALNTVSNEDISALIIGQPNFFGQLEPVDALTNWAHTHHAISIACVNPISLGLLTPPGEWGEHGVDIACGEGQPLGIPMASGGPAFGFFSTKKAFARQLPGRLVGRTVDSDGKSGFTLTLQAREQHIRRGKATSNICTNQGLMVTAATIHMSLLGPKGIADVAMACHQRTQQLIRALTAIDGVDRAFKGPVFHEAALTLTKPAHEVLAALKQQGIAGGISLGDYYKMPNTLLMCATEMRTDDDINAYQSALKLVMEK